MKIQLSTILLLVACASLSVGMYSERSRSTKIQQALAEERKDFDTEQKEFVRNRKRLVESALTLGAEPQSDLAEEESDDDLDAGFMIRDPLTTEEIAVQDLITRINSLPDIPLIVEIVFPDEHSIVLPEIQQGQNKLIAQLWELSGRKPIGEITKISKYDSVFAIKNPIQLKTIIDSLSKSAR